MFEFFLMVSFLFLLFIGYQQVYPYVRKYWGYKRERQELVIRYNRVWRSRKDMLVRLLLLLFLQNFNLIQ